MTARRPPHHGPRAQRGVSIIIVMILLIIIGITASTAMRNATSEQRATNNQRLEATALQYAEAALRYCEAQMKLAPDARAEANLKGSIPINDPPKDPFWSTKTTWYGDKPSVATAVVVPEKIVRDISANNTETLKRLPECVIETVSSLGTVITARGFSPDYQWDSATGRTTAGAVVWLQSFNN